MHSVDFSVNCSVKKERNEAQDVNIEDLVDPEEDQVEDRVDQAEDHVDQEDVVDVVENLECKK
jgi:hypothetical protein